MGSSRGGNAARVSPWHACGRLAGAVFLLSGLFACSSVPRIVTEYKIDVQQGNVISQEMVSQLKPGLTKDQVRFVLGTPMLADIFHEDRWDYIYRLQKGSDSEVDQRVLSVFFDRDGKLTRVAGNVVPAQSATTAKPQPDARNRVIDLGTAPEGAEPPPAEGKGFLGRTLEKLGL